MCRPRPDHPLSLCFLVLILCYRVLRGYDYGTTGLWCRQRQAMTKKVVTKIPDVLLCLRDLRSGSVSA